MYGGDAHLNMLCVLDGVVQSFQRRSFSKISAASEGQTAWKWYSHLHIGEGLSYSFGPNQERPLQKLEARVRFCASGCT